MRYDEPGEVAYRVTWILALGISRVIAPVTSPSPTAPGARRQLESWDALPWFKTAVGTLGIYDYYKSNALAKHPVGSDV